MRTEKSIINTWDKILLLHLGIVAIFEMFW